jgi:hypothetical protein
MPTTTTTKKDQMDNKQPRYAGVGWLVTAAAIWLGFWAVVIWAIVELSR